ncbi:MAG: DUF192 domain-containing protein [Rhodocyclaceae bacterium]|nr:DUF192 domain-containing protein [Rhodocyclaceae bacterium]
MMKQVIRKLIRPRRAMLFVLYAVSLVARAQGTALPTLELAAGIHRIEAEVAATMASRVNGLMFRQQLPPQRGMLFVFPEKARHCMWMKNTAIPLSVAFLEDDGTIVNIADMQPFSEANHCARSPVRFALEMNLGWFARRSLAAGDRIQGLEKAPRGQ